MYIYILFSSIMNTFFDGFPINRILIICWDVLRVFNFFVIVNKDIKTTRISISYRIVSAIKVLVISCRLHHIAFFRILSNKPSGAGFIIARPKIKKSRIRVTLLSCVSVYVLSGALVKYLSTKLLFGAIAGFPKNENGTPFATGVGVQRINRRIDGIGAEYGVHPPIDNYSPCFCAFPLGWAFLCTFLSSAWDTRR